MQHHAQIAIAGNNHSNIIIGFCVSAKIIIFIRLPSTGGHRLFKLTAILVTVIIFVLCAFGYQYAVSPLHNHHTSRSESEQTVSTRLSIMETMRCRESNNEFSLKACAII